MFRILLAEDNPGDVLLFREALGNSGLVCELLVAQDGEKAIAWLQSSAPEDGRLDLIVLDVNLPKHNGGEVLEQVRANPAFVNVPVIMLTSSASPTDQALASRLGANLYIQKPSDLDAFLEIGGVIEAILRESGRTRNT